MFLPTQYTFSCIMNKFVKYSPFCPLCTLNNVYQRVSFMPFIIERLSQIPSTFPKGIGLMISQKPVSCR